MEKIKSEKRGAMYYSLSMCGGWETKTVTNNVRLLGRLRD